ncbi:unnamed protein product [Closterium sp. Naga37s-1]|nr:unnamed protein product [Closterium sp. Naga37s-1]
MMSRDRRVTQGEAQGWVRIGGAKAEALRVRVGRRWAEDEENVEAEAEEALGETLAQKRRRFARNVERMKGDAARRRKLAEKGLPPPPLGAPDNGLLVLRLVRVAHRTLALWLSLQVKIPRLLEKVPAHACRYGRMGAWERVEVSIARHPHAIRNCKGPKGHIRSGSLGSHEWAPATPSDILPVIESFHLPDRLRPRVPDESRFDVERIPSVIELCVQAGVDLPGLRTVRRTDPVHTARPGTTRPGLESEWASGVSSRGAYKEDERDVVKAILEMAEMEAVGAEVMWDEGSRGKMRRGEEGWRGVMEEGGRGREEEKDDGDRIEIGLERRSDREADREDKRKGEEEQDGKERGGDMEVAEEALRECEEVREGVERVMGKYPVMVCGYCPEVHVGAAGHKPSSHPTLLSAGAPMQRLQAAEATRVEELTKAHNSPYTLLLPAFPAPRCACATHPSSSGATGSMGYSQLYSPSPSPPVASLLKPFPTPPIHPQVRLCNASKQQWRHGQHEW